MKTFFKNIKIPYRKIPWILISIPPILTIFLLIKFFLMHEGTRLGIVLGGIVAFLELLISFLSLLNESEHKVKLPNTFIKYKKIILIPIFIFNILILFIWLIPYTSSQKIHSIDSSYLFTTENTTTYKVSVETSLSVDKIVVQVNGVDMPEVSTYTQKENTRCFTTNVELIETDTIYKITAYILTIDQKKISSTLEEPITPPTATEKPTEEPEPPTETTPPQSENNSENDKTDIEPTMTAFYQEVSIPFSKTNAIIYATTSQKATRISLQAFREDVVYELYDMKTEDYKNWYLSSEFYDIGTFDVHIIAYFPDGQIVSHCIQITYPFP